MRSIPRQGELYRHFKNKMYQIVAVATHSETREQLVIYQALYGSYKVYARPLSMFMSEVDHEKYPDVEQKYRFEQVILPEEPQETITPQETVMPELESQEMVMPQAPVPQPVFEQEQPIEMPSAPADDKMMAFFDADSWEEKYNILVSMRDSINDIMIDCMAASLDTVIDEGPMEKRYDALKATVQTRQKYEIASRLR